MLDSRLIGLILVFVPLSLLSFGGGQAIVADITAGVFPIGSRLPAERDLTERFGVSRPTVREAMIALEMQGLVEARKGSGVFVLASTSGEIDEELDIGAFEITEARRLVEGEVAAVAATEIDETQLEALRALVNIEPHAFHGEWNYEIRPQS